MEENNITPPITNNEISKKRHLTSSKIYYIILAIVVAGGLVYLCRYFYSTIIVKAQNDIGNLKVQYYNKNYQGEYLQGHIDMLYQRMDTLEARLATNSPVTLGAADHIIPSLEFGTIDTFVPAGLAAGQRLLLIDFIAENQEATDVYFSSSNYKLKDENNYQYEIFRYPETPVTLPDGRTQTDYLILKPGETTRGTMVFLLTREMTQLRLSETNSGIPIADLNTSNFSN